MLNIVDYINDNKIRSFIMAILLGVLYFLTSIITRTLLRPIFISIPGDIFIDTYGNEILWRIFLFNCLEILVIGLLISIPISLGIYFIYGKLSIRYGLLSIVSYLLISVTMLLVRIDNIDMDWVFCVKAIRPLLMALILWVAIRLVAKTRATSSDGNN